jgi:hypothetical protein
VIKVDSNISHVIRVISDELENIDVKKMTREQASTLMADMRKRIHQQGKASDGSAIGKYSKGYLAVRSGVFQNSGKSTKGKSKGKIKNAGTHTKGAKQGGKRIMYNRGNDPKVILSLTRQMESDMILIPIENGTAIGYSNSDNFNKSQWAEKTYKKAIFSATVEEVNTVLEIGQKYINDSLK